MHTHSHAHRHTVLPLHLRLCADFAAIFITLFKCGQVPVPSLSTFSLSLFPSYSTPLFLSFSLRSPRSLPHHHLPILSHSFSLCHFLSLLPCTILVSSSLTVCPIVVAAVAVIGMWQTLPRPPWPPQPLTSPRHPLLRLLLESLPQFY